MFRVVIDRSLCNGFGECLDLAPAVFEIDRGGLASLRAGETEDVGVLGAAAVCPMGAISVFEAETGTQAA